MKYCFRSETQPQLRLSKKDWPPGEISVSSDKELLRLYEGFGLFTCMKSALLAAIFGITGGVTILLAIPAEEKASLVRMHPEWTFEYGAPAVPQVEAVPLQEEVGVPESLDHYSVAQAKTKTKKQALRHQRHIARARPNFFERLINGFMNLQKPQTAKSFRKRSRTTPAAPLSNKRSSRTSDRFDARITQHGKFTR